MGLDKMGFQKKSSHVNNPEKVYMETYVVDTH